MPNPHTTELKTGIVKLTQDLKKFMSAQPAALLDRKRTLEELKDSGSLDGQTRMLWTAELKHLQDLRKAIALFEVAWKDAAPTFAKMDSDLSKDLERAAATNTAAGAAWTKAKAILQQQADALDLVVKKANLIHAEIKALPGNIGQDRNLESGDRDRLRGIVAKVSADMLGELKTFESNLKGAAGKLRDPM